jgi:hypothetical protein
MSDLFNLGTKEAAMKTKQFIAVVMLAIAITIAGGSVHSIVTGPESSIACGGDKDGGDS